MVALDVSQQPGRAAVDCCGDDAAHLMCDFVDRSFAQVPDLETVADGGEAPCAVAVVTLRGVELPAQ